MTYIPNIGWLQTLDPFAIQITEQFGIRWYGLAYLAGFLAAYFIIRFFIQRGASSLQSEHLSDFIFTVAIGTILGGRPGYCLFYSPELFLRWTSSVPFWGVLAIHEGGMSSHGGILGIVGACVYFARKHKISAAHLLDLSCVAGCLGVFFGRLANFVNGELLGREAPAALSWAIRFPQEILSWPEQSPEKLSSLLDASRVAGGNSSLNNFLSFPQSREVYQALEGILSAVQAGQREVMILIAPFLTPRYPSQLIAALCEGLLIFLVLLILYRRPRAPGFLAASFVLLYAGLRFFTETFRLPDAQIGYQLFGLTRGQWLSVCFFIIGIIFMTLVLKRKVIAYSGGWGKQFS